MQEVVGEILLDDVALVSAADDEIVNAMLGVNLQDVPENGTPTNFDHRLGADNGFFRQARAEATSEDYGFHDLDGLSGGCSPVGGRRLSPNFPPQYNPCVSYIGAFGQA
jgi:hypothetical protein